MERKTFAFNSHPNAGAVEITLHAPAVALPASQAPSFYSEPSRGKTLIRLHLFSNSSTHISFHCKQGFGLHHFAPVYTSSCSLSPSLSASLGWASVVIAADNFLQAQLQSSCIGKSEGGCDRKIIQTATAAAATSSAFRSANPVPRPQ